MTRREFLKNALITTAGLTVASTSAFAQAPAVLRKRKPNLLFIHTDQQHIEAISAHGNPHLRTPNMDRLARRSTSFHLSYSANPVCCPARSCWYSGRTSSETGVVTNSVPMIDSIPDLGQWLGARGYEPVYAGKWHVPNRALDKSFKVLTGATGQGEFCDAATSRAAQGFLSNYRGDNPFFLSLGFLQPHDICYWVMEHNRSVGELPYPQIAGQLPPLPGNFKYDAREPETFRAIWRERVGYVGRQDWTELHWRYYLWCYYRHVEMVDAEVGRVLDALDDAGLTDNTVVIFGADHGEGMAHHQMVLKHYLYDEAARVPLMVSWPGQLAEGRMDRTHLVSGLDVTPTLCDFAGVPAPPKMRGRSLRPLLKDGTPEWRELVVSESNTTGRMLRTPEYKLITYQGDQTEQLFDMRADPGETKNLAQETRHAATLASLKKELARWEGHLDPAPIRAPGKKGRKKA